MHQWAEYLFSAGIRQHANRSWKYPEATEFLVCQCQTQNLPGCSGVYVKPEFLVCQCQTQNLPGCSGVYVSTELLVCQCQTQNLPGCSGVYVSTELLVCQCQTQNLPGCSGVYVSTELLVCQCQTQNLPGCSGVYVSTCRFYIRKKDPEVSRSGWVECKDQSVVDTFLMSFLQQPVGAREYQDLCNLPDLNEQTLLHNLKARSVLWGVLFCWL